MRLSLGASRRALVGQLLVESLMLAVAGAVLGLALSAVAARALLAMLPANGPALLLHADPDLRVLLFGIAATLVTGLLFGVAPALQSTRLDLVASLKDEAGAVVGTIASARLREGPGRRPGRAVVPAARRVWSVCPHPGKPQARRHRAAVDRPPCHFRPESCQERLHRSAAPPVLRRRAAGGAGNAGRGRRGVHVDAAAPGLGAGVAHPRGGHVPKEGENVEIENNIVSPGYWRTMGVKVVEGRDFDVRDAFDPSAGAKEPTSPS